MSTPSGYSRVQIVLHWIVALLIAQQYLFKDSISKAWEAARAGIETSFEPLVAAHILGGALVMGFALWRLMIKARRGAPAAVGGSAMQRALARMTHAGLYLLMILMPVSGAVAWFGGVEAAALAHNLLKVVLLALVALHVVAALFHHFVLKDGLLDRMRRAGTETAMLMKLFRKGATRPTLASSTVARLGLACGLPLPADVGARR